MRLREDVTSGEGSVGCVEGVRCLVGGCDTEGLTIGVWREGMRERFVEREGVGRVR